MKRVFIISLLFIAGAACTGILAKRASDPLLCGMISYSTGILFALIRAAVLIFSGTRKEEIGFRSMTYAIATIPAAIGLSFLHPAIGALTGYFTGTYVITSGILDELDED